METHQTSRILAATLAVLLLEGAGSARAAPDDGLTEIGDAVYAYYLRERFNANIGGPFQPDERLAASGGQNGGTLFAQHVMGGSMIGFPATATVAAYNEGKTFWSQTVSPTGGGDDNSVFGGSSRIEIAQSFRKYLVDATLSFTFTAGKLQLMDYGAARGDGFRLFAAVAFDVDVWGHTAADVVWHEGQSVLLDEAFNTFGDHEDNTFELSKRQDTGPLTSGMDPWTWNCSGCGGPAYGFATATLNAPYTGVIDLSMIPFGSEFTVRFSLETIAHDARQGETNALAYAKDPIETGSGVGFAFTGLTPTNNPVLAPVPEPGTWALIAVGLFALAGVARRNALAV